MASNDFNKEERVAFEDILEGFNDALIMSAKVNKYNIGDVSAERANDTVWRPQPYILQSYDGMDQSGNFNAKTQLSVPSSLTTQKSVPFTLDARELRDGLQENRLVKGAYQRLGSDVNSSLLDTAANLGSVVVAQATAANGYDGIAACETVFDELGVPMSDRHMALSARDYQGMASNLAERQTMNDMPTKAYRETYVGNVAKFNTCKLDVSRRLTAAAGVTVTINGANQRHIPKAVDTTQQGQQNVDNRFQNITIGVVSGTVAVGDAFTIAGVNSLHHIEHGDTGQLKTFRITAIVSGAGGAGVVTITPAIVDGVHGGATGAEEQYQNVTATPANGAAITFLNTVTANVNPFWAKDAIELLPGRLVMPKNSGLAVMRGTTDQGLDVLFTRQGAIDDLNLKYRLDTFWGTVMCNPQMAGIALFGQT